MTEQIYEYDPAQALDGPQAIAVFLAGALETGDAAYIAKALGVVARAKGMSELAKETGLALLTPAGDITLPQPDIFVSRRPDQTVQK